MRNKIPCTAERLGLLDPQMIQSVADTNAFHIGRQYMTENRVRIVEADDAQISSAVIGNSGLYEQSIRLKEGHLISKCSCTLPEEPMCRHCIAVLLEYHRWVQPRQSQKATTAKTPPPSPQTNSSPNGNGAAPAAQVSAPDIKLNEVIAYVEWMRSATRAIEQGTVIPDSPPLGPGDVSTWIHTLSNVEDRRREGEEVRLNLESELKNREAYIGRLNQQLQTSMGETKTAQALCQALERERDGYKEILAHVNELVTEVIRHDGKVRSAASELLSKSTQLDQLTGSFKEVAESLKAAAKRVPPK